jgi:epoxyqueuosine reductase
MLINQEIGSFTLIGSVLVDADLGAEESPPAPDRCGRCRSCIDVCPTGAIVAPGLIDARRCISYLTIELRGPIPRQMRPLIGDHLFGCDLCQNVCPWNSKAPGPDAARSVGLGRRKMFEALGPADVLRMTRSEYASAFRGSAIKRARYDGLLRNAAVVLGNNRNADHAGVLVEQLWENDEPLVRGHIAWALSQIQWETASSALQNRQKIETDKYVLDEIRWALSNDLWAC